MVGILALIMFFKFGHILMQCDIHLVYANALQASYSVTDNVTLGSNKLQEFISWSHSHEDFSADVSP
jgi:hypothetical protein